MAVPLLLCSLTKIRCGVESDLWNLHLKPPGSVLWYQKCTILEVWLLRPWFYVLDRFLRYDQGSCNTVRLPTLATIRPFVMNWIWSTRWSWIGQCRLHSPLALTLQPRLSMTQWWLDGQNCASPASLTALSQYQKSNWFLGRTLYAKLWYYSRIKSIPQWTSLDVYIGLQKRAVGTCLQTATC